jgi:hypothetical protein
MVGASVCGSTGYHRQPTTLRSAPATGQLHPVSERDSGGEDVQAVVGDQHVLLETHAAEALHLVDAAPVDAVAAAFSGEQRGTT